MAQVRLLKLGPGVSLQDAGRAGFLAQGLSRGGAADMLALAEGAALLGQGCDCAALEIAGSFLTLEVSAPTRIALTGAPMQARTGETALAWHASHLLPAGARLDLSASAGGYSYVHLGGGVAAQAVLGARSAHMAAGLGPFLTEGETLALGQDSATRTGLALPPLPRFNGGLLRLVETPQTGLFPPSERARFCATTFRKHHRANRLGQRLDVEGPGFEQRAGLNILSEIITPGDIQITGDGTPFVLLSECQTTGGYPRIGTVLPCDLPRLVQAPPGAALSFAFVTLPEAVALERAEAARRAKLGASLHPLIRDPHHIPDLLRYQLISGVTCGDDLEQERA